MLTKLIGTGLVIFGGAMVILFPYPTGLQHIDIGITGALIGLVLIGIGLFLIKM